MLDLSCYEQTEQTANTLCSTSTEFLNSWSGSFFLPKVEVFLSAERVESSLHQMGLNIE